jgi:hypothetical protein
MPLQKIVKDITYGGVILSLLLPIGIFLGIKNPLFHLVFFAHLFFIGKTFLSLIHFLSSEFIALKNVFQKLFFLFFILFLNGLILIISYLPITARDALIHHLAIPKLWIQSGKIHEVAWHEWSYYPMLIQLAYTELLSLGLEWLTPYYHGMYLLLFAYLITATVKTFLNASPQTVIISFIYTLSLPVLFKLSTVPLVDIPLALYTYNALVLIWLLFSNREKTGNACSGQETYSKDIHLKDNTICILCGISLGLGAAVKYNGLLVMLSVLLLLVVLLLLKEGITLQSLKKTVLVFLFAIATFSPWALKNFYTAGNPVYPMGRSFFSMKSSDKNGTTVKKTESLSPLIYRRTLYNESIGALIALPLRMFFSGEDNNPKRFDGVFSEILILGLFLTPFLKTKGENDYTLKLFFFLFTVGYCVVALLTTSARIRYLAPCFGPLIFLTFSVLTSFFQQKNFFAYAAKFFLGIQLMLHTVYASKLFIKEKAWEFFTTTHITKTASYKDAKEAYLLRSIQEYLMIQFMNEHLSKTSQTYLLFTGNKFYYYETPVISSGYFSESSLKRFIQISLTPEDLLARLQKSGITHFGAHFKRTFDTLHTTLSEKEYGIWDEFSKKYLKPVFSKNGYGLLSIQTQYY